MERSTVNGQSTQRLHHPSHGLPFEYVVTKGISAKSAVLLRTSALVAAGTAANDADRDTNAKRESGTQLILMSSISRRAGYLIMTNRPGSL